REPRRARVRAPLARAALARPPEHRQLGAPSPPQDAGGRRRELRGAPTRRTGAEERLSTARHDRAARRAFRRRRRRWRSTPGSRDHRPGTEAESSDQALGGAGRADAGANFPAARRADAPALTSLESALLETGLDHEPGGSESADRRDCNVRFE